MRIPVIKSSVMQVRAAFIFLGICLIARPASAQFTDNPPSVWATRTGTGVITATPVAFTIDWCDDHGILTHDVTINGVNVNSSLTYVTASPQTNCAIHKQSTGSLAMIPGNDTLIAIARDTHNQYGESEDVYRFTDVQVTGPGTPISSLQRRTDTANVVVKNLLNSSQVYDLSVSCTGQLSGCATPPTVSLGPLAQATIAVTYTTDTTGTSGVLQFKAWLSTNASLRDSSITTVISQTSLIADMSFNNNDDQPAALCTMSCFAATASYATVPYFSLGTPRSIALNYNGDRVAVRPFVYADIAIVPGASVPQEFWLQVKDSASGAFLPFTNGDATKVRYAGTLSPVRLVAQVDASQFATSMRTVYVIVTAVRSAFNEQAIYATKLRIVNERSASVARGWTIGGLQQLYVQPDGTVLLTDGDGSGVYFSGGCSAPCTLHSPTGDFTRLRAIKNFPVITYVREYVDSSKVFFRSSGLMDSVSDRFGNTIRLEYDASNRLVKVYDPFRTYNILPSLRSYISLTYGSYGLIQIQEPGADGSPSGGRITRFTIASDSTLAAVKDPDGDSTRFTYDGSKRLQSIIDRGGNTRSYSYDATSWGITSLLGPSVAVDAGGGGTILTTPTTNFHPWQLVGLPTASTMTTTASTVRADTIQARIIDPAGNVTAYTVDRWGQPLIITDAMHRVTTIARSGILDTSITYPSGARDRKLYTGALPTVVQPFGRDATTFTYGAYGQILTMNGPNQPTLTNFIGTAGRIDSTRYGSNNYTARYSYDALGRTVRSIDPGKDTVLMHYEFRFGNLDSVTAPGGRYSIKHFDGRGRDSTTYALGRAITTTLYDSLGRVRQFSDGVHTNATIFSYDKLHLIRVQDPQHQVYRFTGNALGWQTAAYDPADTANRLSSYRYRADGVMTSMTNRRGQRIDFVYDSAGRLISKRGPANIVADSFAYNAPGTVVLALNATSRDSIFLDAAGWTDSTVTRFAADPTKRFHLNVSHDSQYRPTSLGIDAVAGITFPTRTFSWNSGTGILSSIMLGTKTLSFGVDNEGRRDSITYEGALRRIDTYSTIHTTSNTSYGVAAIDTAFWRGYGVDSLGRMSQQERYNSTGTLIDKYNYSANAELRRNEELTSTSSPNQCTGFGLKNDFGGSCLNLPALTQTKLLGFTYDSVSNLIEERDSIASTSITGRYAVGNRDTSWAGVSYSYDLDGNRLRKRPGADSVRYFWSADNRLDSVYSAGLRVHYEYNAFGQLVRKSRNGVADRYLLWGNQQLLVELNGGLNARISEYAYSPNTVDRPIALMTGAATVSATRYHQQDALGNVIGLSTLTGVAEQVNYTPWGQSTISIGAALADTNRLQWKGLRWENDSTQLYYARARWYDPGQRRFVSEDPMGLGAGTNDYTFASNDPIDGADPSGLCSQWQFIPSPGYDGPAEEGHGSWLCEAGGGDTTPAGTWSDVDPLSLPSMSPPLVVTAGSMGFPQIGPEYIDWPDEGASSWSRGGGGGGVRTDHPKSCTAALIALGGSALFDALLFTGPGEALVAAEDGAEIGALIGKYVVEDLNYSGGGLNTARSVSRAIGLTGVNSFLSTTLGVAASGEAPSIADIALDFVPLVRTAKSGYKAYQACK